MEPKRILAVDIGGSKLLTALADVSAGGEISFSGKVRRELAAGLGKEDIFAAVTDAADRTLSLPGAESGFDAMGVTI
ncbi:MAG: hypothetical protein J6S42_01215, partial [Thermoguttaceae bacterium]|nr:hypothetical protein [Thermoguttaceae bacterium]